VTSERWRKIEELYHAAREREPGERVAYLAGACHGDDELKRQIETLLAQDSDGNILGGPASKLLAGSMVSKSLSPGDKLGPYEILSPIGAGGMGEVWKARDTRLDRTVAIKTSKVEFNERFEREARAVAALNHPHICQLYDVGPNYLVMEFVEGPPLKGPMPLDQALSLAIQLAGAMDAAHRKGITHRDLKPANVIVTKSGVKVLDFGIAKIQRARGAGVNEETVTQSPTRERTILGTLQYMAPEQLQAKEVDGRADIFSFGCVFYEMLTGKRAFDGANTASSIAAVMERPAPSVSEVAPAALDRVLKKCLEKDPDDRWQTARDLRDELAWVAGGSAEVPRQVEASPRSRRRPMLIWGGALLLAALAAYDGWELKPAPARPLSRFVIGLARDEHFANLDTPAVAISPDGAKVVYVASRGSGPAQLFLRPLDALKAEPAAGTEGAASPFFSPDGQWIAFFAGSKLKKVAIAGSAVITLCDASNAFSAPGGTWGPHNNVLFQSVAGAFLEVPSSGGTPRRAAAGTKHTFWRWPQFMPDGGTVVFAGGTTPYSLGASTSSIAVAALNGASVEKDLIAGGTAPHLAATGDLLYAQNATLMAVSFNRKRLELTGSPIPVLEGVRQSTPGAAQYGLSDSGTLVYIPGGLQGNSSRLVWVDRAGKEQPLAATARGYSHPRLSPDGRRIAVMIAETETQVWLYDMARDILSRATFGGTNVNPVWSPDGKRFAFQSDRAGPQSLFWQPTDGSGAAERLSASQFITTPHSWSPDGQVIAFIEVNPQTGFDIWTVGLGDKKAQPFLKTQANETSPRFSPDEHWLAYESDESGRREVYIQPYPGPGGKWQLSTEGGTEPVWNPSGRELFYRSGNRMMAVPLTLQPRFSAGKPMVLFEGPWLPSPVYFPNYDVSRDGQRFLMLKAADEDTRQIVVVQNWFEELKRRMAAGRSR
jgi:eukaryotic-like serine/threonine-protein kinase